MTVSLHSHRDPPAVIRHVQNKEPEQIAAGNDGAGNGEIPKPRMFAKERFLNNLPTLKKLLAALLLQKSGPFTSMIVSAD